jgi:hypothetical protein
MHMHDGADVPSGGTLFHRCFPLVQEVGGTLGVTGGGDIILARLPGQQFRNTH